MVLAVKRRHGFYRVAIQQLVVKQQIADSMLASIAV